MKKFINKILLPFILSAVVLTGCASDPKNAPKKPEIKESTEIEEMTEVSSDMEILEEIESQSQEESQEATEIESVAEGETEIAKAENNNQKQQTANNTAVAKPASQTTVAKQNKIVATSAAVCEITDRLGIDLIGVPTTTLSALPNRYSSVKKIGSPMEPDMEIIKALKPSDVITPDTLKADLKVKYDNIGVNSTFVNLRSVEGLYDSVKIIGDKYGKSAEADKIVKEYKEFMAEYSNKHKGQKPKVLVLMGLPGSYLVATNNSYAGSLVELAGGVNVFHDSKDFLNINTEEILAKDPDVIIRTAHGLPEEAKKMFAKEFSTNDIWKHFRAVKNGKVYDVDYKLFGMSANFDYPQALVELEKMLYGD